MISSDSELTLESQTQTRSSISCLRNPSKVRLRNIPYLTAAAAALPSHLDSGLGLSISSLEDVPSEDEATEPIVPSNFPDTNPDTRFPVVSSDPASPFRDRPSPLLSESSAS